MYFEIILRIIILKKTLKGIPGWTIVGSGGGGNKFSNGAIFFFSSVLVVVSLELSSLVDVDPVDLGDLGSITWSPALSRCCCSYRSIGGRQNI